MTTCAYAKGPTAFKYAWHTISSFPGVVLILGPHHIFLMATIIPSSSFLHTLSPIITSFFHTLFLLVVWGVFSCPSGERVEKWDDGRWLSYTYILANNKKTKKAQKKIRKRKEEREREKKNDFFFWGVLLFSPGFFGLQNWNWARKNNTGVMCFYFFSEEEERASIFFLQKVNSSFFSKNLATT